MMLQKNKSQWISLAKFGLSAPLFILMLVLSSATIDNKIEHNFLTNADTIPATNRLFVQTEKQPEFPGGFSAFGHFLASNIRYPLVDKNNKVQGRVLVQFVVERDGSITDIKAIRGPSETLNNEAIRVMKLSPSWEPGYQNNKPVRVAYTVPINFTLNNSKPMAPPFKTATTSSSNDDDKTFIAVEKEPEFPGGVTAFGEFLGKNIKYPVEMRQKNIQGRVIITFIVEKDGSLSNIQAVKSPGYGSSEEAIRVMSLSPKWEPGYQNGKAVRVAYTVPINFSLNNEKLPVHGAVIDTGKNKKVYN
jgi:TonB family protein